jgi:FixJ family two-component response regulator
MNRAARAANNREEETMLYKDEERLSALLGRTDRAEASAVAVEMPGRRHRPEDLTPREREILDQVWGGCTNRSIAQQLGISIKTVEAHRANIMEKLNANTVADLLKIALGQAATPAKA